MNTLDESVANAWNQFGRGPCSPEMTWRLCRVLEQARLAETSSDQLAVMSVGPFRLASQPEKARIVRAFIEGGLPAVVRALCEGMTFHMASLDILLVAFHLCAALGETSVLLSDPTEWCVLTYTKHRNQRGEFPTRDELLEIVRATNSSMTLEESEEALKQTLDRLRSVEPLVGDRPVSLLGAVGENSFEALV